MVGGVFLPLTGGEQSRQRRFTHKKRNLSNKQRFAGVATRFISRRESSHLPASVAAFSCSDAGESDAGHMSRKPEVDVTRIIELHFSGLTAHEIADILGCCHQTVSKHLRSSGISTGKGVTVKHEVECVRCGKKFETDNATRVICDSCRETYDHPTAKCECCGKEFEKMFRQHRYCSKECREEDNRPEPAEYEHECRVCGKSFVDGRSNTAYCSDECRNYKPVRIVKCCWCYKEFTTDRNGKRYCSQHCIKRAGRARRKARFRTQEPYVDDISLRALYDRDGGVCQICGEPTDWDDCAYNENGNFIAGSKYPTHDHIVPVSKGGKHTWDNAQLACFECNTRKSAKMPEVENAGNAGCDEERLAPGTAPGARAGDSRANRRGGRITQHGTARPAVSRNDTRNSRVGSGKR